ncbi:MAG: hypothetical protein ACRBCJ_04020 [Hyphomicrobiaceae bacterium]
MKRHLLFVVCALTVSAPSHAVTTSEDKGGGRYTMAPSPEGGFVRLDTQTGVMAHCQAQASGWSCNDMPESNRNLAKENERLRAENKALNEEIKAMEETFGLSEPSSRNKNSQNDAPSPPVPPQLKLPTEKDVDQALDYVERMIKKFQERFRQLENSKKRYPGDKSDEGNSPAEGETTPL